MENNKQISINIKEYFESILTEKEKRVEQRFADTKTAVDAALTAADRAVAAALAAQKEAVIKAENASEKRFESINEFRSTLRDQQNTFTARTEYTVAHAGLIDKIDTINSRLDKIDGTGIGRKDFWGYAIAGISIAITVALFILRISGK